MIETQIKTNMRLTSGHLFVDVDGVFSVEYACDVIDQTLKKCLECSEKRVLMDVRKMSGDMSVMDRFNVALHARVLAIYGIKTAMIGRDDQILPDNFLENVLVNRGVEARILTTPEQGEQWLAQF
jgi:hypothetical protein